MASIKMFEILRSIRLHPFLRRFADIGKLTKEEARRIDEKITK